MIFLDFLKVKFFLKICSKTHQIAPLNFFGGGKACSRTPLANAWLTTRRKPPPPPNNSWPPLANPACAHELLMRNLFKNPPWQTVDCV